MSDAESITSVEQGISAIRRAVKTLPETPGVYRMLDESGEVLYVGKAKALKRRVNSYTNLSRQPMRLKRMIALTRSMEFVYTETEVEALLLESNLIKKLKPRFNILLRDDKSFPYIMITTDHDFPQIKKHRGARRKGAEYYGPFASAGNVNRTITVMQRAFLLRNCTDHVFANRSRPCLQYHIKRCTAPCVGYVTKEEYAEQLHEAQSFFEGDGQEIQKRFSEKMDAAAAAMDYEKAAKYRDRLRALASIQSSQDINVSGMKNTDVVTLIQREGRSCIQVFFFRAGQNFGNHSYFPSHDDSEEAADIMMAFLAQFYESKPVPPEICVNVNPRDQALLEEALSQKAGVQVSILKPQRGTKRRVIEFAERNAMNALDRNLAEKASAGKLLDGVAALFGLEERPKRIEVYDNSHISGTNMVGGMIVAGEEGFHKNAYRKFNIKTAEASDDYGMMREVITRRFKRALNDGVDVTSEDWPDVLLIDGGQGQYNAVKEILEEYGIFDALTLVAIAKGEDRHAGREKFFIAGKPMFQLPINDPVLHYLQRLRDEAHRFAIGAHRTRRKGDISKSPLDDVPGIGPARKKALLHRFGSGKAVLRASLKDLRQVEGISEALARKIYEHFHEG